MSVRDQWIKNGWSRTEWFGPGPIALGLMWYSCRVHKMPVLNSVLILPRHDRPGSRNSGLFWRLFWRLSTLGGNACRKLSSRFVDCRKQTYSTEMPILSGLKIFLAQKSHRKTLESSPGENTSHDTRPIHLTGACNPNMWKLIVLVKIINKLTSVYHMEPLSTACLTTINHLVEPSNTIIFNQNRKNDNLDIVCWPNLLEPWRLNSFNRGYPR